MAFETGENNDPKGNRSGSQNNPADNPNKKDRVRGEDDVLKDQKDFESEAMDIKEVDTHGDDARPADEVSLDEWAVGGYCL